MKVFAQFNSDGFPLGFWVDEIHEHIPAEAAEITPEEWALLTSGVRPYRRVDGQVIPYDPPPVEPPFPSIVTAAQAKIALFNAGLLDQVRAVVSGHPYEIVRIWYADANQWERGNPYVQAIGAELSLDNAALDNLFIAASAL